MDRLVIFLDDDDGNDGNFTWPDLMGANNPRAKPIQIGASFVLGLTAFLTFCVLRPRWTGLYAARKKQKDEATALPELPTSLFGWILPLWRITDQQILASAGLDAYAFLAFFKLAIKFLVVTLFFSLIVIKPVHDANPDEPKPPKNGTDGDDGSGDDTFYFNRAPSTGYRSLHSYFPNDPDYLWMYLIFAYLFSGILLYLLISATRRMIEVRQEFLGTQTSVTDRTIRLSGIPAEYQDEEKIKEFIESLDIGKVESVTVCRDWKELDDAVAKRLDILRRLEEAYTIYMGRRRVERNLESLPISQPQPPHPYADGVPDEDDERAVLLNANGDSHDTPYERSRPKTRIRYGFLGLRSRKVDGIHYYEEKLRQIDEKVVALRKKTFKPTPLAFVTMDSVAACQMATQAVLDPSPLHFIASHSPAPADVIWPNTYLPRRNRIIRAWCITSLIGILTLFWSGVIFGLAGLLSLQAIRKMFPQLPGLLEGHQNIESLLNTQLPTLIASLLIVLVPYLYYWLSWYQGFISQGDVELSAISKNFFFTFFNFFVVLTISGTGLNFWRIFDEIGENLKRNIWEIAYVLAESLQGKLLDFYFNFIILQGLGLFPFRLLEVGSVSLYPVYRIGAKTPRDYAELVQPPIFSYGFYVPTALLIFIICMVYSVMRSSWEVLLAGLVYFALGHFVYKYQLLYAMDNQQQVTGWAWIMICDRIFMGLIFFQLATTGQLLLKKAVARGGCMVPLIVATIWISIVFRKTYRPLMRFIALSSVKVGEQYADNETPADVEHDSLPEVTSTSSNDLAPERRAWAETDGSPTGRHREIRTAHDLAVDESHEPGKRYINPSLVTPLDSVWIANKDLRRENGGEVPEAEDSV